MATSPLNRKRTYSSSSSTSSGTNSTSSEEIHPSAPKGIKLEENSPSYNEERRYIEKSSTSTTDSDHESLNDWEPAKKKWKREFHDDYESFSEGPEKKWKRKLRDDHESLSEGPEKKRWKGGLHDDNESLDEWEPAKKRWKRALHNDNEGRSKPEPSYSSFSMKMMASMGYKPGFGLGKTHTGITAPIEESLQKGRRGLGLSLDGLEKEDVKWEQEEVDCHQVPVWLPPCEEPVLAEEDIQEWITIGARKMTIDDESLYCSEEVLDKILQSKTVFDSLDDKEFLEARQRANPYETIKGAIFQNRAAMKMANIDSVFDFMFTKGFKQSPNDVLYFADICAGPGGFSEYVFWRKKWHAKGFGMTLKEPNSGFDFKLDSFIAGPCETFDPHYGVGGYSGNGDITDPSNLEEFQSYVLQNTDNTGVHFVMADGGASVEGQENIQEILMKQLVLCQYLCALSILRTGGHFVCKVFDMFTPFSVGLFYLLYRSFEQVCIFKPVTSRPANSERYVVCRSLKEDKQSINRYLFIINETIHELKQDEEDMKDILEVVPDNLLQTEPFYTYITDSNDSIGVNQIIALKKLKYFVKNTNLQETRQAALRNKCLQLWEVPTVPREAPVHRTPKEIFDNCWKKLTSRPDEDINLFVSDNFKDVKKETLPFLLDPHSWKWCFACGRRFLLVGLGRNQIHSWDMRGQRVSLFPRTEFQIELPKGTILEVEIIPEMTEEGPAQRKIYVIYIMDIIAISHDVSYAMKPLKERLAVAEKLCKVLNKPCQKQFLTLKVKPYYRVFEMVSTFGDLRLRNCKGLGDVPTLDVSHDDWFIAPIGVIFCKVLQEPWQLHFSQSSGKLYFFNYRTNKSSFEPPKESISPFLSVLATRHIWRWLPHMSRDICDIEEEEEEHSRRELAGGGLTWSVLKPKLESIKR